MEESYETFEEELGPQRAGPPPQKPVHRRPGGNTHTHTTKNLTFTKQKADHHSLHYSLPGYRNTPRKAFCSKTKQANQNISLVLVFRGLCHRKNVGVFIRERLLHPQSIQQAAFAF